VANAVWLTPLKCTRRTRQVVLIIAEKIRASSRGSKQDHKASNRMSLVRGISRRDNKESTKGRERLSQARRQRVPFGREEECMRFPAKIKPIRAKVASAPIRPTSDGENEGKTMERGQVALGSCSRLVLGLFSACSLSNPQEALARSKSLSRAGVWISRGQREDNIVTDAGRSAGEPPKAGQVSQLDKLMHPACLTYRIS